MGSRSDTYRYRGYEIVPRREYARWSVGVYSTQADLPILSRSTLKAMTPNEEEAVAEAKQTIDRILAELNTWRK